MSNESLLSYANKLRTDKGTTHSARHGYTTHYEHYFEPIREDVKKVLEIGIGSGASHNMWAKYFSNAMIYGVDHGNKSKYATDRIIPYIGNQEKREDLLSFIKAHGSDFDIIIDDGGHTARQQQVSFGTLFKHIKPGGFYVIEDLCTSPETKGIYWGNTCYGKKVIENDEISTLKFLEYLSQEKFDELTNSITHCTAKEKEYLISEVADCDIRLARMSEISFIRKKL